MTSQKQFYSLAKRALLNLCLAINKLLKHFKINLFLAFSFQRQLQDFQHIFDKMELDALLHAGQNIFQILFVPGR